MSTEIRSTQVKTIRRRAAAALALMGWTAGWVAGCSPHVAGPQNQSAVSQGVDFAVSVRPGLPQDISADSPGDSAQTGDNTLVVVLRDADTNSPIPDANVTAAPTTDLIQDQAGESGRSQGNGVYYVPIRFSVPDTYTVRVSVQRPGIRDPITAQFQITVS